jgi:hypothetical protein
LVGLVQDRRFSGFGHALGNLVPCCRECNSAKGNKPWEIYLRSKGDGAEIDALAARLRAYQIFFDMPGVPYESLRAKVPQDIAEFEAIEDEIMRLMARADEVAARIRMAM